MCAGRSVLVLTDRFDPTADRVVEELNARGSSVLRCDVADFPERLSVSAELDGGAWSGAWLHTGRRSLNLAECSGIYYRRPTGFELHPELSADERRWSAVQARLGFGGLLAAVGCWLNHPHHIGYAEYKPVQLRAAVACGLRVPRTLVTNDPARAAAFVTDVGRAVCKPFGGHGATDIDGYRHMFATIVTPQQCGDPNIARTMHMFQQWVPKAYEVRLTVVDNQFYAARIDTDSEVAYVDWRADYHSLSYTTVRIPRVIQEQVAGLLRKLNLRFGALDFVVTPGGEWWFLECNPNGQWAWIEDETGMPIAAAVADALENRPSRDRP